jgi:3-beta hydroxysteroid dehydrogenase/isomerase family
VLGETVVLSANGQGLATVALRPSGIFGEGDPLFVPVLIDKAAAGKMKYMIGNGRNVMDFTYVGNVAQAHIQVCCWAAYWSAVGVRAQGLSFLVLDTVVVLNMGVAHTHQAAEKLVLGSPVAGRPYFITNDEPRRFWEFLGDICEVLMRQLDIHLLVLSAAAMHLTQQFAFKTGHVRYPLHSPLTGVGLRAAPHQAAFWPDLLAGLHI